jgi:tetratricopeptide (TPR) repeat protein
MRQWNKILVVLSIKAFLFLDAVNLLLVVAVAVRAFSVGHKRSVRPSPRLQRSTENGSVQATTTTVLEFVDKLLLRECAEESTIPTKEEILDRITRQHGADYQTAVASPLALEPSPRENDSQAFDTQLPLIPYEWISSQSGSRKVAIQSLLPVLNATEIAILQTAAETIWQQQQQGDNVSSSNSRFTYQFKGNSEAHAADFASLPDQNAIHVVNNLLVQKLYPWVRENFVKEDDSSASSRLFVYDSLFIRYNASASDNQLAGQPLHRDLGVVSVNIMLNEGFQGGGTYFDNQAEDLAAANRHGPPILPLVPLGGPGCCLAHWSNERHAGAGTTAGVRDILVFFLSLKEPIPKLLNAHLKQTRSICDMFGSDSLKSSILCRIRHQRLAVEMLPDDGEAYLYMGSALMDYAKLLDSEEAESMLQHAIRCLQQASTLTPHDARVWNNWGIALVRLQEMGSMTNCSVQQTYQRGLDLLLLASHAGCAVQEDLDALSLNFGLYLANRDMFADACYILERPASRWQDSSPANSQTVADAYKLWRWCHRQMECN